MHEHLWDEWSFDLSFVKEVAEMDGVHTTKKDLCRFQLAMNSVEKVSWFMLHSKNIIEELSMRCYHRDGQARGHMKNFVIALLKGLKKESGSVKALGSMEVGITCEVPDVPELDEYAEELQNVFDNINGARLDPVLLSASRKVEIDFMNRLEVYRKRPRSWPTDKGLHVIPTKWVDVNKGDAKSHQSTGRDCVEKNSNVGIRRCQERLRRWDRLSV